MSMAQIGLRLREQMTAFLGNVPVSKTAWRFVLEALYGIQTRQSLKLSEIARSLHESIALIETENRLSRQAGRAGLDQVLTRFVIEQGAPRVKEETLLLLDPSDIAKPYAKQMEYLARVRDGSAKEIANGYWLCQVVGVDCGGQEIVPLINRLWSQEAPDFVSENAEILNCVDQVRRATQGRGIWVVDRGGDRGAILEGLLARRQRFIVRLVGNRNLTHDGQTCLAEQLAAKTPLPYVERVTRQNPDGTEKVLTLSFGLLRVKLPGENPRLGLVVLQGFGEQPLMLLTNLPLRNTRKTLWWMVEAYLTRWRVEDTLRFAKQSYNIEDVRVLGYQRLKNMMALVLLAMYFAMVYLGQQTKLAVLCHHAIRAAQRFFGIPDFRYYAIADGIRDILGKRQTAPFAFRAKKAGKYVQLDFLALPGP